jgi:SAM-dependent methyltransferase
MSILELGCGTGKQSLALARLLGETGHVTAVDISAEALEALRNEAVAAADSPNRDLPLRFGRNRRARSRRPVRARARMLFHLLCEAS